MKTKEASPASGNWTNAPDKVYLSSCMRSDFIKAVTNGHTGEIEYIRKDALLEWAKKENLKFNHTGNEQDDNFARGIAAGLGYLISKLSSM